MRVRLRRFKLNGSDAFGVPENGAVMYIDLRSECSRLTVKRSRSSPGGE